MAKKIMNILFLTLVGNSNIKERGIYNDLMRKLRNEGHQVYIVLPTERREKARTRVIKKDGITLLKVRTLNIQKTSLFEKGLSTITIESLFLRFIKKHFKQVKFDLILCSTPPITFTKIIKFIKKRDNAQSYLMLKDIFPQNAVDLKMMKKGGLIHRYFRRKEKMLYEISDFIGCMSPANVKYLINHNPEINPRIIEENPNSIELINTNIDKEEKNQIRINYKIPLDATVFIYGGNLGIPQGIDFLIEVLNDQKNKKGIYIIIIGDGTMYKKIKLWFDLNDPQNASLLSSMSKTEYDKFICCADVGMIFLDKRFTIPNFPSRMLSYIEIKKPVLLATDSNTDIGKIAIKNDFGLWVESGDLKTMTSHINYLGSNSEIREEMGSNGFNYLLNHYTTNHSYSIIMSHFENVY